MSAWGHLHHPHLLVICTAVACAASSVAADNSHCHKVNDLNKLVSKSLLQTVQTLQPEGKQAELAQDKVRNASRASTGQSKPQSVELISRLAANSSDPPWSVRVDDPMWVPGATDLGGELGYRTQRFPESRATLDAEILQLQSHDARLRIALAGTVVGMVVVIIVFFYLAHCPEKDIRLAMWSVVGSTLTCFCAMLLFNAMKESTMGLFSEPEDFLENDATFMEPTLQVLGHHLLRAGLLLGFLYFSLSALSHLPRTKEVFAGIGAHIVGFSLTEAFGSLQLEHPFNMNPMMSFLVVIIAGSVIMSIVAVGTTLRSCWFKQYDEEMEAAFEEAENHYTGLTLGLLVCQTIKFMIVGHLAPVHGAPKHKTPLEVGLLVGAALLMALMVTTVSYVNAYVENSTTLPLGRATNIAQRVACMTLGWNLLFAGEWAFWSMTGGRGVADDDDMIAGILLLLAFGVFGFIMIFIVDFLASTKIIQKHAMQALIDGVALAIGLTWEVSVDTAVLCLHGVIANGGIRFVDAATDAMLFLLIMPAHVLYISPRAKESQAVYEKMLAS
mmetsp:Transcript_43220/g.78645  ORF Transcript_43220/g.78645 Transcript_43220/m.78645 type:complete len:557 (-) Transcript_43220:60-1730(-)